MITKSPYGFGYGHKGRIAGTEPEWEPREYVRKPDPQHVIDQCLYCTKEVCTGECEVTCYGRIKGKYRRKMTDARLEKKRLAEEQDRKDTEMAKQISKLCLDGWCERAIARKKGIPVDEVNKLIKLARKKGFLY